ncbi:MAG: extracellular solute-binding protein [Anaerolineae bacterium]|nr:extracellular solute-binding protein [Anaerolineae bacterium]
MQPNKLLFFAIIIIAVLVLAGMFLARTLLVNNDPITLSILYSTEKEAWLDAVSDGFEGSINGRPIELEFEAMGSREIYLSVLDGSRQPDVISPASALQISILHDQSTAEEGIPIVSLTGAEDCRSVVSTPLVLVAWQERAEALGWLEEPDADMWEQLRDTMVDPQGWSKYNHPEWSHLKFGQTDPNKSNSGLMALLLITYDYFNKTAGLASADIVSPDYGAWFSELGQFTTIGDSTGTFMQEIVAFGPSKYDIVAVYEATAIEQIENAAGRYGELRVYYPPSTVLSDHPFCALHGDWVTDDKAAAARQFVDYLLSQPVQAKALELGFRPADQSIALDGPNSPFSRYAANGIKTDLPPEVEVPAGEVLNTLINFWNRNRR